MPKNYDVFLKGGVGDRTFNSDMVNYILEKNKDTPVNVLINSLGGFTYEGVAISSLFKLHGDVHVHFVGHNASAATIAAMGAKRITIDEDAAFLVHKCKVPVVEFGMYNADDLEQHIKELDALKKDNDTIDRCVACMYARRCKKPKDELLELMHVGGWLTPEEALEWGFVDEITNYADDEKPDMTTSTLSAMYEAGIPVPPTFRKKNSILGRFLSFLQSPFYQTPLDDGTKNSIVMSKLKKLSAILGENVPATDSAITLSAEQADKVDATLSETEDTIASLNKTIDEKNKEIERLTASVAEKDTVIAELRKQPADKTSGVFDTAKGDDAYAPVSEADAMAASKAFIESFK